MRRALIGSMLVLACVACDSGRGTRDAAQSAQRSAPSDFTFDPGTSFGPLNAEASEEDLIAAYGAAQVQPEAVSLGEGESEAGSVVFPDDPLRRFEVAWGDTLQRRAPSFVLLTGDTTLWQGKHGLTLGMSLAQLETLNGKPFGMAGYGWDYGGSVLSWKDGQLADLEGRVAVALAPRDPNADVSHVLGDGEFLSSDSTLRRLQPRINRLVVRFE
jgi:hypothetical protein